MGQRPHVCVCRREETTDQTEPVSLASTTRWRSEGEEQQQEEGHAVRIEAEGQRHLEMLQ